MTATRRLSLFASALALVLAVGLEAAAQTRSEILTWRDTLNGPGAVVGYRIHYGTNSGSYVSSVDVGLPTKSTDGLLTARVIVEGGDLYFAVTAYDLDAESFFSNEVCRGAEGTACGSSSPPPDDGGGSEPTPPPTTGPYAAVTGFALWDAQSDTRIDSNFVSGEQIDVSRYSCTAIEILGNSYLNTSGPGSVKYVFDGQDRGCTDPGLSHENTAPFAWEVDEGPGKFACALSLTLPGTHTLKVTPYDGDNCTGAVGSSVTLTFSVVSGSSTPPTEPLGQPGQPQIVIP